MFKIDIIYFLLYNLNNKDYKSTIKTKNLTCIVFLEKEGVNER